MISMGIVINKKMIKLIISLALFLFSILTFSQNDYKKVYIIDNYHNRDCLGGTGFCSENMITLSNEKSNSSIIFLNNKIQVTIEKNGFSEKEWEELVTTKIFPVDEDSAVKIDEKLLKELSIDTKYNTIKPNKYPVTFKDDNAYFILELIPQK